jgi:hypothetical protein
MSDALFDYLPKPDIIAAFRRSPSNERTSDHQSCKGGLLLCLFDARHQRKTAIATAIVSRISIHPASGDVPSNGTSFALGMF